MAKLQIVLTEEEVQDILKDRLRQAYNIPARAEIVLNWNNDSGLTAELDDGRDTSKPEGWKPMFAEEKSASWSGDD